MSYRTKGGKVQRSRADGWTQLFDKAHPSAVVIRSDRPSPEALKYLPGFAADILNNARTGKPSMCLSREHDTPFLEVPNTFAVAKTDKNARPVVMGFCTECSKKSDAEILDMIRADFKVQGVGDHERDGIKHKKVQMDVGPAAFIEVVPGVRLAVCLSGVDDDPHECQPAAVLKALFRKGALPRFMAFQQGAHNCHAVVHNLRSDFNEIGIEGAFSYKRGSSNALKSEADPQGLHSWIEADGWAIDASGGALGNPIIVQRVADFYAMYQLENIIDIESEQTNNNVE
jgi:hypothetical protein